MERKRYASLASLGLAVVLAPCALGWVTLRRNNQTVDTVQISSEGIGVNIGEPFCSGDQQIKSQYSLWLPWNRLRRQAFTVEHGHSLGEEVRRCSELPQAQPGFDFSHSIPAPADGIYLRTRPIN